MSEENKNERKVKVPWYLKKPIKKKFFEKRYVKYIEQPDDRKFLTECFAEKDEESVVIRETITNDEVKKLKKLIKIIKENRKGTIKAVPLLFAGCAVTAIVIFFMLFANPLLSTAMEKALENVFEAKVDVRGFRLGLVPLRFEIQGITVADRDSPMTNLFEMGRMTIRLKTQAVLRGKVYIEEIRADTIRFGTARTVSGAIPGKPPREKRERPKNDAPPLVDLKNFDAMALLNQEFNKLSTPKMYDEAINAYNEAAAKWKDRIENANTRIKELQSTAAPLLSINMGNMRDAEVIRNTIQDVTVMVNTVQRASDDAADILRGIETDLYTARRLEQNALNALTDDINHLKSYIDLGSGEAFAAIEPFIRDILSDTAQQYLNYGLRALEALEKIKELSQALPKNEKPVKEPKTVFRGRDVIYPVTSYPAFYMGVLASDFTIDSWNWAFDLRNVSSNPDLSGGPVTLALGLTETGANLHRNVAFNGSADFRTNPQERFKASVNAGGFPFSVGNQLSMVGINGFSGEAAFSINANGRTDGAWSAGGVIKIGQAHLVDPRGTLAEAIDSAIRQANDINLGVQYTHNTVSKDEFNLTTNIMELILQALRQTAEAYARRALDEIERVLRQKIDEYIQDRFDMKTELDSLFALARGDKTAVDQLTSSLTNKKDEFEQRLRTIGEQAVQQARDEAVRQGEQALQDLMQGQTPSLPTVPSLPRFPGF